MLNMNLQLFAHKKGVGSTKNGRDSESKRLGAKRADGQFVLAGNILTDSVEQRFIQVLMLVVVAMIHYSHLLMELLSSKERARIESRFLFILLFQTTNLFFSSKSSDLELFS